VAQGRVPCGKEVGIGLSSFSTGDAFGPFLGGHLSSQDREDDGPNNHSYECGEKDDDGQGCLEIPEEKGDRNRGCILNREDGYHRDNEYCKDQNSHELPPRRSCLDVEITHYTLSAQGLLSLFLKGIAEKGVCPST